MLQNSEILTGTERRFELLSVGNALHFLRNILQRQLNYFSFFFATYVTFLDYLYGIEICLINQFIYLNKLCRIYLLLHVAIFKWRDLAGKKNLIYDNTSLCTHTHTSARATIVTFVQVPSHSRNVNVSVPICVE